MKILLIGKNGNIAKIIRKYLDNDYEITSLSKDEFNIINFNTVKNFLENNYFDILINTAIIGGRRTKKEDYDSFYFNILMFENLIIFANKFKLIINLDSGAIYDRETNILNRKENELFTVPKDFYGLSKYIIYNRTLNYNNIYNFRIFNIFYNEEENDRFIKSCFLAKKNNSSIVINEDKFFDFFYELDFIKVLQFYINNINNTNILHKTINLSYSKKFKLSDIANLILNKNNIIINKTNSINNYSGDNTLLSLYNINLMEINNSLIDYQNKIIL